MSPASNTEERRDGTRTESHALCSSGMDELIERCRKGETEAWQMLVDHCSRPVFNLALHFSWNREDAADLTQDIFIKVFRSIDAYESSHPFLAWVMRIARNHCIDHWRRQKRGPQWTVLEGDVTDAASSNPQEEAIQNLDADLLRQTLTHLDPEMRTMLTLRDVQGQSYQEIAQSLELPLGTVKSRINRARIHLSKILLQGAKHG